MVTPAGWIETEATVTTCRYQSAALPQMAFGFSLTKKFRITFDYYAHGQAYSGEFQSDVAVPQNERVPLAYNPLAPAQNTYAPDAEKASSGRGPLLAFGVIGSIVLSLAWLLVLRGCS